MITREEFERLEDYLWRFTHLQNFELDRSNCSDESYYRREEDRINEEDQDIRAILSKIEECL